MKILREEQFVDAIKKEVTNDHLDQFFKEVIEPDGIFTKEHQLNKSVSNYLEDPQSIQLEKILEQYKSIKNTDWNHFYTTYYKTPESPIKSCFRLFKSDFESVSNAVAFLAKFPDTAITLKDVFIQTGWHRIFEFINESGKREIRTEVGKYWPVLGLIYKAFFDDKNGEKLNRCECHVEWLLGEPDKEELQIEERQWDRHSVDLFQLLQDEMKEIIIGYDINTAKWHDSKFRIFYHHLGKQLQLSKRGYFEFPIIHRFKPKIAGKTGHRLQLSKMSEMVEIKGREKKDLLKSLHWKTVWDTLDKLNKYDDLPEHPAPTGYLDKKLMYIDDSAYKKLSTENPYFLKEGQKKESKIDIEKEGLNLDLIEENDEGDKKLYAESFADRSFDGEEKDFWQEEEKRISGQQSLKKLEGELEGIKLEVFKLMLGGVSGGKRYTQEQIAEKIGKDQATVSRIMKDIKKEARKILPDYKNIF